MTYVKAIILKIGWFKVNYEPKICLNLRSDQNIINVHIRLYVNKWDYYISLASSRWN